MEIYERIEAEVAKRHGATTTSRKAIGDFMLGDDHAVNVKSNNVAKANYSPNMISIKKMHEWVFEKKKNLSFVFIDYKMDGDDYEIVDTSGLIPIEHIKWSCLSIEAQGFGVIQKNKKLEIDKSQTKRDFYEGFLDAYQKYLAKEKRKHEKFAKKFIKDLDSIDW